MRIFSIRIYSKYSKPYGLLTPGLCKSPKLYFYDVGLAATLVDINQETILQNRGIYGALFENMAIVDIIKNLNAQDKRSTLTFYRDTNQNKVDLITESKGTTTAIEIKASETMQNKFFNTANWLQEKTDPTRTPVVVYGGNKSQKRSQGSVVAWDHLIDIS